MFLAVDRYPDDFMLNFDFAYMLEQQQRWPLAIRYYLKCTAIRPEVSGPWRTLGNCYRENDETNRSRESLKRAVSLNPQHGPIYVDLAQTLVAMKDYAAAETAALKAIDLGCQSPRLQFTLGVALMETGRFAEGLVAFAQCDELGSASREIPIPVDDEIADCKRRLAEQIIDKPD